MDFKYWEGHATGDRIRGYVKNVLKEWDLEGLDFYSTSDAGSRQSIFSQFIDQNDTSHSMSSYFISYLIH